MDLIKNAAFFVLFFLALGFLLSFFINATFWLSAAVYPILIWVSGITLTVTVVFLIPNAFFSPVPKVAGTGMIIASYIFGATVWGEIKIVDSEKVFRHVVSMMCPLRLTSKPAQARPPSYSYRRSSDLHRKVYS